MIIFTRLRGVKAYRTKAIEGDVHHRQKLIPGFDQSKLQDLSVLLIGAGGLGGEVAEGLARKGIGVINICDGDIVTLTNLNRQKFFKRDINKNKAVRLSKNVSKYATGNSVITGYPYRIQEMVRMRIVPDSDVAMALVDNEETRIFCSQYFKIPVIFSATGTNADRCYAMVQRPCGPCYRCLIPEPTHVDEQPCHLPSCIDVNKIVSGLVLFAIDSLLMSRERNWNYKEVNLSGYMPDKTQYIEKNPHCPLCGENENV